MEVRKLDLPFGDLDIAVEDDGQMLMLDGQALIDELTKLGFTPTTRVAPHDTTYEAQKAFLLKARQRSNFRPMTIEEGDDGD